MTPHPLLGQRTWFDDFIQAVGSEPRNPASAQGTASRKTLFILADHYSWFFLVSGMFSCSVICWVKECFLKFSISFTAFRFGLCEKELEKWKISFTQTENCTSDCFYLCQSILCHLPISVHGSFGVRWFGFKSQTQPFLVLWFGAS